MRRTTILSHKSFFMHVITYIVIFSTDVMFRFIKFDLHAWEILSLGKWIYWNELLMGIPYDWRQIRQAWEVGCLLFLSLPRLPLESNCKATLHLLTSLGYICQYIYQDLLLSNIYMTMYLIQWKVNQKQI